jgi:Ner family transcriptional regulator
MSKFTEPKKTATPHDWHRADIVAAIRKAGWSLRRLAKHHGYAAPTTLTHALDRPWPKGERIIADAIGVSAAEIWPSRYHLKHTTETPSNHRKPRKSVA